MIGWLGWLWFIVIVFNFCKLQRFCFISKLQKKKKKQIEKIEGLALTQYIEVEGKDEEAVSFLQQQEVEAPMEQEGFKDSERVRNDHDHDHSASNYVSIEIPDTAHQISQGPLSFFVSSFLCPLFFFKDQFFWSVLVGKH